MKEQILPTGFKLNMQCKNVFKGPWKKLPVKRIDSVATRKYSWTNGFKIANSLLRVKKLLLQCWRIN